MPNPFTPKTNWLSRDGDGYKAMVEGLGLVEIYQSNTNQGRVCVINGQQHSGGWRYNLEEMKLHMNGEFHTWHYLNQFKV